MITLSTEQFTYNPDSKHFAGDASEVGTPDEFDLRSQWTDFTIRFTKREVLKSITGEDKLWRYTPKDLAYSALSLTIYNT